METYANTRYYPNGYVGMKAPAARERPMAYQLVGEVTAHQGYDGYRARERGPAHWDWDTAQTPTGGCSQESSSMDASLKEQCRVEDEGPRVVNSFYKGRTNDGTLWIRGC